MSPRAQLFAPGRETYPKGSSQLWQGAAPAEKLAAAVTEHSEWLKYLATMEELFEKHVYGNENPTQLDFRQHRHALYRALAWGESLALQFATLEVEGASEYVPLVDRTLDGLREVLNEWQGPTNDPAIPESFREGMRQALAGATEDLDEKRG